MEVPIFNLWMVIFSKILTKFVEFQTCLHIYTRYKYGIYLILLADQSLNHISHGSYLSCYSFHLATDSNKLEINVASSIKF